MTRENETLARIFFALALFAVLLLVTNLVIGWTTGDVGGGWQELMSASRELQRMETTPGASPEDVQAGRDQLARLANDYKPVRSRMQLHLLVGLLAALVTVLVNSIAVTYFIGTTRWCREVCETYQLGTAYVEQSNQLKRKTFPAALASILIMLVIISAGAMADPGANSGHHANWVMPHWMIALLGTIAIAYSFFIQVTNIGANYEVIQQIVARVNAIRAEGGLDDASGLSDDGDDNDSDIAESQQLDDPLAAERDRAGE